MNYKSDPSGCFFKRLSQPEKQVFLSSLFISLLVNFPVINLSKHTETEIKTRAQLRSYIDLITFFFLRIFLFFPNHFWEAQRIFYFFKKFFTKKFFLITQREKKRYEFAAKDPPSPRLICIGKCDRLSIYGVYLKIVDKEWWNYIIQNILNPVKSFAFTHFTFVKRE